MSNDILMIKGYGYRKQSLVRKGHKNKIPSASHFGDLPKPYHIVCEALKIIN